MRSDQALGGGSPIRTALRLRCRAPSPRAAAERVVQCRAPPRSRSSPPTPSPRRAALPVRERWLRERLRGASRRRPQRGWCRFRCRRSVVRGHLGRSRAAGRPDRARGIGLHPAVSMGQQSSTACGRGLDRDREYADPALDWAALRSLIMPKLLETADRHKAAVAATFWASNHRPYVPTTGGEHGREREGETARSWPALCTLSVLSAGDHL